MHKYRHTVCDCVMCDILFNGLFLSPQTKMHLHYVQYELNIYVIFRYICDKIKQHFTYSKLQN